MDPTDDEWDALIEGNLTSIVHILRLFPPLTSSAGAFIHVNGLSAEVNFLGSPLLP